MCTYTSVVYKVHYVCVPCRQSHKFLWDDAEHLCTRCRRPMVFAGHDFAAPRKSDDSQWAAVAAVLGAGLRYEGFVICGCSRDPKYRPQTSAQVRARRRVAAREGLTDAEALALRDIADA
ncbi:hypothetical protein Pka01_53740 [Planotetraspora kaengkrachanensis]|uniref:Deoxyxylulose-5-phosphate synthase n=2 Tax=Planotetraspora kaengkrachanensis TaxID=575193 RepID=A0A8J3PWA3_9ACTN|nr:hypothetical protein Pka01_53740 [Planotetraspora kaengkrachanensis]